MKSLPIILTFLFVSYTNAVPVPVGSSLDVDKNGRISTNELFQQLNQILEQNIHHQIKDHSIEIGDKFESDKGNIQIEVHQFEAVNGFPVTFKPIDNEILEEIEVIPLEGGIDSASGEYLIKRESLESTTEEQETTSDSASAKKEESSTSLPTTSVKKGETSVNAPSTTTETSSTPKEKS